MLAWLKYFFRGTNDGTPFVDFSPVHLLLLAIAVLLVVGIIKSRHYMNNNPKIMRRIEITVACILILCQVLYYIWFVWFAHFGPNLALPLYTCRAASILGPLAIFTRNKPLKVLSIYWGFYAVAALIFPDMEQFAFPHVTQFIFWGVHISLLCLSVILVFWGEGYNFPLKDFKIMMVFMLVYMFLSYPTDMALQGNYHFFLNPPVATTLLDELPRHLYDAIVMATYLAITALTFGIGRMAVSLLAPDVHDGDLTNVKP